VKLCNRYLSKELNIPTTLSTENTAYGVKAASRTSLALSNGNFVGVLPLNALTAREIQQRTPYKTSEFLPLIFGWSKIIVLLIPNQNKIFTLDQLKLEAQTNDRPLNLLHDGLDPVNPSTLMALDVIRKMSIDPNLVYLDHNNQNPAAILAYQLQTHGASKDQKNRIDSINLLVRTLEDYLNTPNFFNIFTVLAVLADNFENPKIDSNLSLSSLSLSLSVHNWTGFYQPAKTSPRLALKTALVLDNFLNSPETKALLEENYLTPAPVNTFDKTGSLFLDEYKNQQKLIEYLQFSNSR
jgi:tripartite-type tricarboxylate transporter receptor subunit TctC